MKNQGASNTTTSLSNLNKSGSPYPFKRLCKNKIHGGGKVYDHVYTFVSTKKTTGNKPTKYQANVIEYEIGVFAVKFHLNKFQRHPDRYKILSNNGDAIVVLKTIVGIMLDILSIESNASFAFIGMPCIDEGMDTTKRYTVYEKFCQRYFSLDNFEHIYDKSKSFYMLLNRRTDISKINSQIKAIAQSELAQVQAGNQVNLARSTA